MKVPALLAPLFIVIPTVAAHGFVAQVTVDGKAYSGNAPNAQPAAASVIREISTVSPVKGTSNPFLNCGMNAQLASQVAPANPGSNITFSWKGSGFANWPHNTGPMLTYMASCGSTTCDKYNSSDAQWFKIDQVAKDPNNPSTWVQASLMTGGVANVTIPNNLAPGNYLIRHEIIALQLAVSIGGAEFYPSCTQLSIGGSGTAIPSQNELVSLPGAYSDTDPGIYDPNVYNDVTTAYVFPGPPIAQLAMSTASNPAGASSNSSTSSGTSSGSSNNGNGNENSNSNNTTTPPTGSTAASSGSCRLKVGQSPPSRRSLRPQTVSRIMRHLHLSH